MITGSQFSGVKPYSLRSEAMLVMSMGMDIFEGFLRCGVEFGQCWLFDVVVVVASRI